MHADQNLEKYFFCYQIMSILDLYIKKFSVIVSEATSCFYKSSWLTNDTAALESPVCVGGPSLLYITYTGSFPKNIIIKLLNINTAIYSHFVESFGISDKTFQRPIFLIFAPISSSCWQQVWYSTHVNISTQKPWNLSKAAMVKGIIVNIIKVGYSPLLLCKGCIYLQGNKEAVL